MTTPAEDILKIGANAVDALRVQPALLFLILLNCIVFTSSYFALENAETRKAELFNAILTRCTFEYSAPEDRRAPPSLRQPQTFKGVLPDG